MQKPSILYPPVVIRQDKKKKPLLKKQPQIVLRKGVKTSKHENPHTNNASGTQGFTVRNINKHKRWLFLVSLLGNQIPSVLRVLLASTTHF